MKSEFDLGGALLQRRCIYGEPLTLEDMATWRGCTRERVRQVLAATLIKIRNRLRFTTPEEKVLFEELMAELFERREPAMKRERSDKPPIPPTAT